MHTERDGLLGASASSASPNPSAADEYFDAEPRARRARTRAMAFVALGALATMCVGAAMTDDMLRHTRRIRGDGKVGTDARRTPRLGGLPQVTPAPPWKGYSNGGMVATEFMAMNDLDQVPMIEEEVDAAKYVTPLGVNGFEASRYLDGENKTRRKLETPMMIIALDASVKDQKKALDLKASIERSYRLEPTQSLVTLESATYPARWPETIELADEAVEELTKLRPYRALYYIQSLHSAHKNNDTLPHAAMGVSHHIGCLFSHMRMWRLHAKRHNQWSFIFESDGGWWLGAPPKHLQSIVDHAPHRADLIFTKRGFVNSGQFVKQWKSGEDMMYMYRVNRMIGGAGLSSYLIGPNFVDKIYEQIVFHRGADMVDAWLMLRMCSTKDERYTTYKSRINCFHAESTLKPARQVGGYLPEWYGIDETPRDTDNWNEWLKYERNGTAYYERASERMAAWNAAQEEKRALKAQLATELGEPAPELGREQTVRERRRRARALNRQIRANARGQQPAARE